MKDMFVTFIYIHILVSCYKAKYLQHATANNVWIVSSPPPLRMSVVGGGGRGEGGL